MINKKRHSGLDTVTLSTRQYFNFSNTLASFQGYVNKILAKKLNLFVIMYLNNILIYTKDLKQDYVKAIRWVFNLL